MPLESSYPDRVLTRVLGHDVNNLVGQAFIQETLTAARTYYVRTDGSDSNTGLVDSAGGAWLTLQHAYDAIIAALNQAGFTVTIQVRDGTYAAGLVATGVATGPISIVGNVTTRANVLFSTGGSTAFQIAVANPFLISIASLKLTTTGGYGIHGSTAGARVGFSDIDFGSVGGGQHLYANAVGASLICLGNYVISGGGLVHYYVINRGYIELTAPTVTLTGTPAFTIFAYAQGQGLLSAFSATFTGSATGQRYNVGTLGYINSFGGGANYFPGDSGGAADATTFGLYQ